jgi:hypothetical protein
MSSKDTHDERDLGYDGLNRRNILLAGSRLAAASALSSSLSSAQQAGAFRRLLVDRLGWSRFTPASRP